MTAEQLFEQGYTELVSVTPPNAPLAPGSKIKPEACGKIPGVMKPDGDWIGSPNWAKAKTTLDDAREMDEQGANIGLRAERFPGIDIDVTDEGLAEEFSAVVEELVGRGPVRVGQWPKRLFPCRLEDGSDPFGRTRITITGPDGTRHLVEILAKGQQYVIAGIHPKTKKPYQYPTPLVPASALPTLSQEQVRELQKRIEELCRAKGLSCQIEGEARLTDRVPKDQDALKAKDLDRFEQAVKAIPNTSREFPGREDYIRMGIAIRAATQDDPQRGLELYQDWADRWEDGYNDPEQVKREWESFRGPFSIGADYVIDLARGHGFYTAGDEFESLEEAPPVESDPEPPPYSELWAARKFVDMHGDDLIWIPDEQRWATWEGNRWRRDIDDTVLTKATSTATRIAETLMRTGGSAREAQAARALANRVASRKYIQNMMELAKADKRIVVPSAQLDADPYILGTPVGAFDLKTVKLLPSSERRRISRSTQVSPSNAGCQKWKKFLEEITNGNADYIRYSKRWLGYCLTGDTSEQLLHFLYGPGGNGKSVFLDVVSEILGDYAVVAPMDSFTSVRGERHPTDLAGLQGARWVTASETQAGRSWDEARVKLLTGGESIRVRRMHEDFYEYRPTYKLAFSGNQKPDLRGFDQAMKRRMVLLPFLHTPVKVNPKLKEELLAEGGAILSWMIEGCREWQQHGLGSASCIEVATEEYFEDQDPVGRWIKARTVPDGNATSQSSELYRDYQTWCFAEGERTLSQKAFSQAILTKGFQKDRRVGLSRFSGIALRREHLRDSAFPALRAVA